MLFDPTKLPDKKWLTLFEATAHIALGEALSQDGLRWLDYPSARTHYPEISSVWERCRDEARGAQDGYPEFLKMIESFSQEPFHPPPSAVLRHIQHRPPSSRSLYKLLRRLEQAQERDEQELVEAKPLILRALLSRDVLFTGVRDGNPEEICMFLCDGLPEMDVYRGTITGLYAGTVQASSSDEIPMYFGKSIKWTDVNVERSSLVQWNQDQSIASPASLEEADDEISTPEPSPRRKPGQRPYPVEWWDTIKPIAREIHAEFGYYDRVAGATQTELIRQLQARLAAEHKEIKVSDGWLKPKLRAIGL